MSLSTKLWNKDFLLVVIGQIISLFGNAILRFALPLYLLDLTGSSTIYGTVLACSAIPMILLAPIGGIFADRVNKRNIMALLDFSMVVLIVIFTFFMQSVNQVLLVVAVMMLLYAIQGAYQPTVQASIPILASEQHLLSANAIINQISSLAGLIGPVIGGLVYGFYGLFPVLIVAGIAFFGSSVLAMFIHIPYKKQVEEKGVISLVKHDFSESILFMRKDKPVIWQIMCIVAAINLFLASMIIVGMPVIIKNILQMSSQLYGYAQATLMAGGLAGGIIVGVLGKRIKIRQSYLLLVGIAVTILPMGIVLLGNISPMFSYFTIMISAFFFMTISTVFNIQMIALVQGETASHLIGKVFSFMMVFTIITQPLGNAMYGVLFDVFAEMAWLVIFIVSFISILIAIAARKVFQNIQQQQVL